MQISRIRLSDKMSCLRTRPAAFVRGQADETEVPVEVWVWIEPTLAPPDFVFVTQPPAQPRCSVDVERIVCTADAPYTEVVRPAPQHAVQLPHQFRGLLPRRFQLGQLMNLLGHVPNTFLRRPQGNTRFSRDRRIPPAKRVSRYSPCPCELPLRQRPERQQLRRSEKCRSFPFKDNKDIPFNSQPVPRPWPLRP